MATPPAGGGASVIVAPASAVSAPLAGLSAVEAGEAGTSSSNHGVKSQVAENPSNARGEASGVWDYITLTVSRAALVSRADAGSVVIDREVVVIPGAVERHCHGADEEHETAKVLPSDILDWLLPGHDLKPDAFEVKGWQGYKQSARIYAPGLAVPVGIIARDGNADTVCVSITGAGMFAVNLRQARLALEHYGARITRLDAAFDDLCGDLPDVRFWRDEAVSGAFDGRGSLRPSRSFVDDLGSGAGSALYVGKKGDKQLNIYEKGKQNGDPLSPHLRFEGRWWAKNRVLPYQLIERGPLAALVGMYPALGVYLPEVAPSRARTMRQVVEAKADAMVEWLASAAGKSVGLLRDAARKAGATDSEVLDLITREGMPARFGGVPDVVAQHRTAEYLEGVIK